ncbi:MAG: hypothetical protein M3Y33_08665 [Actinomycetota bacterium]|nr:hypothetical protein [Actinomycetota bacterium]
MIRHLYPAAAAHLAAARAANSRMAALWNDLREDGTADYEAVTDPDGTGRITAWSVLPESARPQLTVEFYTVVNELWACLDTLVAESVAMFAATHRIVHPHHPRYFPIAPSLAELDELLAESCLDGVLQQQANMIIGCQSFQARPAGAVPDDCRRGLTDLLEWVHQLADGATVGTWITPVSPHVEVDPPATLTSVERGPAGPLDEPRDVTRYAITGYARGTRVRARPGCHVDIAFPPGFQPRGSDDILSRRVRVAFDVVDRFLVTFAYLADHQPGVRAITTTPTADIWTPATQSDHRWSQAELDEIVNSELGIAVVRDADELTLILHTPDGVFERPIPDASPLRGHVEPGTAAEDATHDAAATWGLPDFVIKPFVAHTGSGVREVGDGLIYLGTKGLVIQVKTRFETSGSAGKEARWLTKKITEGTRQAAGSVRRLQREPTTAVNGRGRTISIDPLTSWTAVVIIDHPDIPADHQIAAPASAVPTVVLLRRDWEFLFHQLRSTHAVVDYPRRVETSAEILGAEPERYFELAHADTITPPEPLTGTLPLGAVRVSAPLLPTAPAGAGDEQAHAMYRIMLEDIAESVSDGDETDRLRALAQLDHLPVVHRTELGRLLLDELNAPPDDPETVRWRRRTIIGAPGEPQLSFAACSKPMSGTVQEAFRSWALLRHHERDDIDDLDTATSVCVLLTPRRDGLRQWDTTLLVIIGPANLAEEQLDSYRGLWNHDPTK